MVASSSSINLGVLRVIYLKGYFTWESNGVDIEDVENNSNKKVNDSNGFVRFNQCS